MCEVCSEFSQLLVTCEARLTADVSQYPALKKSEVEIVLAYILSWPQRQCMCCYRDLKNFDRFNLVVQSILYLSVCQLKSLKNELLSAAAKKKNNNEGGKETTSEQKDAENKDSPRSPEKCKEPKASDAKNNLLTTEINSESSIDGDSLASEGSDDNDPWTMQQKEKLMHIVSKIFLLNFPLYIACKHSAFSRLDDLTAQEITSLSSFCDLHDTEIPVYLLRNVNLFCKSGGICAMTSVFENSTPESLPVSMAHSIVAAVGDIKLWLNYRAVTQFFLPLRSKVLKYMCNLEDKDLRLAGVKTMADFMWGAVKDPLDTPVTFDNDGLDLAFKYFSSSTLTMRLAGITQINTQISLFNEICASEPVPEAEAVGQQLAQWLCTNQIMQHLFGPNLHVEVIKQAHIILKFLAVENRITNEHIDLIWQAAQLKHCSKQVYDLLPGFIKNLAPIPCSHLYQLLCTLPPREHTEQSLYLASALMRVMWSRTSQAATLLVSGASVTEACSLQPTVSTHTPSCSLLHRDSSSEASVSMDPTNSDEDPCEELSTSEEAGPTPRKQSKQQNLNPLDEQKWHQENNQAKAADPTKPCQKRTKNGGASSGSVSSGVEDLRHPPKKKVLRRRKNIRRDLFADIAKVELGELIESISDAEETSGSEPEVCALPKNIALRNRTNSREQSDPAIALIKQTDRSPERTCSQGAIHECPTLCDGMDDRHLMELLSGDDAEASISSAMSNKSDKNMADFDGEESGCEEELARLAAQAQCMGGYRVNTGIGTMIEPGYSGLELRGIQPETVCSRGHSLGIVDCFPTNVDHHRIHEGHSHHFNLKIKDVCKPGNTLLWDLLQDHNIKQLGEGLAMEAEKALYTLLGYNTDKFIRLKFIEGCLDNLANHTSVGVSLRLLPKLFSSFQIRGLDMHQVVLWAEKEHRMMELFFNDLKHYINNYISNPPPKSISEQSSNTLIQTNILLTQTGLISPLFSHFTEINVRLQFLTTIFSPMGSPSSFRLTLEQVDTLWNCLAHDPECSDCFFTWLSSHAKSTDQHALSIDALKYLYIEKMPTLNPETISIMGLSFYQQLCSLARMTLGQIAIDTKDQSHPHVLAVNHLWKIALKAKNTDVSMGAIQYLNSYYMNQHLQQEEDFLSKCMSHLSAAAEGLKPLPEIELKETSKNSNVKDFVSEDTTSDSTMNNPSPSKSKTQNAGDFSTEEASLQCIQRALLLLKTHLDTFKRRYAYHVRRWAQSGASVCGSSVEGSPLRVIIQPGGINVKATLDMHNTDYVADLRAQVTIWWEQQAQCDDGMASQMNDGPIRMITQGQELTFDFDEKTLYEMGFKDNQLVFLSVGGTKTSRAGANTWGDVPSQQPPPPRSMLPTLLLLKPQYFDRLFALMQTLGEMTMPGNKGERVAHMKAQLLSRRVWDILHAVPLSPILLEAFENPVESQLPELLNPSSPQHLMYSLHIVDKLSGASDHLPPALPKRPPYKNVAENTCNANSEFPTPWSQLFVKNGGLRHLYDILMSGVLQNEDGEDNEWQQDCLVLLLKLIGHLGIACSNENQNIRPCEILTVPRLHESLLSLMDVEGTTRCLMNILAEAARPKDPSLFKTGLWGRAQVVQHCMGLLVCWAHSSSAASTQVVCSPSVQHWLPRLLLEDPQPQVRRETCSALYRLCLGGGGNNTLGSSNSNNSLAHHVIPAVLQQLLDHLPRAEGMRPCKIESMQHHAAEEGKEPYGPACRDYFWLTCRLVDGLPSDLIKENGLVESIGLDLNSLCQHLTESLSCREIIERREDPSIPDDGLFGQLNLLTHLVKHPLPFKNNEGGKKLLDLVFGFLFDVANPTARLLPKCKSQKSRAGAYDLLIELVKGSPDNYMILHHKLLEHHQPGPHSPYPWDYWPAEEGRSECGYVGLTNLGATCYMASCMQHLYMMPQARSAILKADPTKSKHQHTLIEMQRMFAYLLESERKAYNPRSFCKVYQMDHQPLNTGEQKDMAEFFIDLVSKLEEMTPELKTLVKTLFCGVLSNNVVSLDCNHVSRTLEEFYTVRCQVADMRNLYQSLDEVTVKDTLEGDNCYTCSQCSTKVRAEKRACFKKLPHILCFNTMRYTFNMVTMLKEKVNTHFSFPMKLDMSEYVEKHLMPGHYQEEKRKSEIKRDGEEDSEMSDCGDFNENYEYELIGVTVHTGTADGGHYYSFIKERNGSISGNSASTFIFGGSREKWLLFNDAEVKPFDPAQIASECFGGEMTSKTYDSATDKFMDFCFEKTNSAYMLFYERGAQLSSQDTSKHQAPAVQASTTDMADQRTENKISEMPSIVLSPELQMWIWEDNMNFLHQKNIFQHAYFTFMGQMCSYIPQSLLALHPEITERAAQLSTSFFIETFIHAKEKPTMVSWVELVTKQFNASALASEWFLGHMASNTWWPMQVLIKCPNQMVRQMFQRLCIHVIQRLRSSHCSLYLQDFTENAEKKMEIGDISCVTRFIKMLLSLMESGAKAHLRHLTEYFSLLYEFSKMGEEESQFLLKANAISMMVSFYLGHTSTSTADGSSSDDGGGDKLRPAALDKMVALVAGLVERSRDPHKCLNLTSKDQHALQGGKGFPFLYQQTRDCLNLQQTKTLIHAMCRWNDRLAQHIISMIFQAISKHTESCQPFFKLLTLLVEGSSGASSGLPCFTQLALQQVWDTAESCPHATIEWLALQVPRNKMVHSWVLQTADSWVETYLMAHANQRVRSAAAFLLISIVPSLHFRQGYRSNMRCVSANKDITLGEDAYGLLHQVYTLLLGKLKAAKKYIDVVTHGPLKLTAYFSVLSYCLVSRIEKIMFGQYFRDLWDLFHPGLSEPSVAIHPNKQALLSFWHTACVDCPENVQLIVSNPTIGKHIAFNYILADHNDCEVVSYNRVMLPSYYAILRLCCQCSSSFTRTLSQHQNIHWAFKNITSHPNLYAAAIDELFRLMQLFAARTGDASEQELREVNSFRRSTLTAYLQGLNGKTCWTTLISAFRTLVDTDEDRLYIVYNGGLQLAFEAFHTLHAMYHEAGGAAGATGDLCELLALAGALCRSLRSCRDCKEARAALHACKDWPEALRRLATLLNTYNPPNIRNLSIALLKELLPLLDCIALAVLVPLLSHCHSAFQDARNALPLGPYFPVRSSVGSSSSTEKTIQQTRPLRPMVQMCVPHAQLQARKGSDPEYDNALFSFYHPYHSLLDAMCRLGVEKGFCTPQLISLVTMAACEAAPLQFTLFPTFWHEIYITEDGNHKFSSMLLECRNLIDYMDLVLLDERETLINDNVYQFFMEYFPKVEGCKVVKSVGGLIAELESKVEENNINEHVILGDVRALEVLAPHAKLPQKEEMFASLKISLQSLLVKLETMNKEQGCNKDESSVNKAAEAESESPTDIEVEKLSEGSEVMSVGERDGDIPSSSSSPTLRFTYIALLITAVQNLIRIVDSIV